jgi:hypothetical protein
MLDRPRKREERGRYDRTRDYEDERRPVDLGRTAKPYPEERSHREDRDTSR